MPRKNSLAGAVINSALSLNSSINSNISNISFLDNISYQINATGTPSGTFAVQVSLDYNPQTGAGNWVSLSLSAVPTLSGADDNIFVNLQQVPAQFIRLAYTAVSGSGSCNIYMSAKEI